jgi:hypothetical protein
VYLILRLFTTSSPFNDSSGNLIELINGILIVCKEIYLLTHLNLVYLVRLTFENSQLIMDNLDDYPKKKQLIMDTLAGGLKDNCNEKFILFPKRYNFDQ